MDLNMAVLDALADDFEGIEQIKKYLFFLGCEVHTGEIEETIQKLLDQELIRVVEDISDSEYTWYGMTEKGRLFWHRQNAEI